MTDRHTGNPISVPTKNDSRVIVTESTHQSLDGILRQAQACLEAPPTIVLGSGASADFDIPTMADLNEHILQYITRNHSPPAESLRRFKDVTTNLGFESAFNETPIDDRIHSELVNQIWSLISEKDSKILAQLIVNSHFLPLTRLYRHLFSSTHTTIDLVTTNYDRLAEYAADAGNFAQQTGFSYGHLRAPSVHAPWTLWHGRQRARTVRIWKVHGSIDWFLTNDNRVVAGVDPRVHGPLLPLIVTPGERKYQITHTEPFRSVISKADDAMEQARAFFVVGYGFSDEHIHPKLRDALQRRATPLLILAKQLTQGARDFLAENPRTEYLAFESAGANDTLVHFGHPPAAKLLKDIRLWNLDGFLTAVVSR